MRRTLAAFVVILLAAMTSWASACDLACSLAPSHSACEVNGAAASAEHVRSSSETAMDAGMVMSGEMPLAAPGAALRVRATSCTHSPCDQILISALTKSAAQHPVTALALVALELPVASAGIVRAGWPVPKSEPPDLQPFDPLSVSLRI
jgi:hypothetical protein